MSTRFAAVSLAAIAIAAPVLGQTSGETSTQGVYSDETWQNETQVIRPSGEELLGGPVRQPGEIRLPSDTGPAYDYADEVSTVAYATRSYGQSQLKSARRLVETANQTPTISTQRDYIRPGTQVQTVSGAPLGRVALVANGETGEGKIAWVRPPNSNDTAMQQVRIRSVTYHNGKFIAIAG